MSSDPVIKEFINRSGSKGPEMTSSSCTPKNKTSLPKLKPEDAPVHFSLDSAPKLLLGELRSLVKRGDLSDPAIRKRIESLYQAIPGGIEDNWQPYALKTEYALKIGNPRQYTESKFYLQWLVDQGAFDANGQKPFVIAEIKRLEAAFSKSKLRGSIDLALVLSEKDKDGKRSNAPILAAGGCGLLGGAIGGTLGFLGGPFAEVTVPGGALNGAGIGASGWKSAGCRSYRVKSKLRS